jgi:hypothetical protein
LLVHLVWSVVEALREIVRQAKRGPLVKAVRLGKLERAVLLERAALLEKAVLLVGSNPICPVRAKRPKSS